MLVLVNGSSTKEFILKKAMGQGDPLARFLFLIATEDLVGVSRIAVEKDLVESVEIGSLKVKVNMLPYVNDTLFSVKLVTKVFLTLRLY